MTDQQPNSEDQAVDNDDTAAEQQPTSAPADDEQETAVDAFLSEHENDAADDTAGRKSTDGQ